MNKWSFICRWLSCGKKEVKKVKSISDPEFTPGLLQQEVEVSLFDEVDSGLRSASQEPEQEESPEPEEQTGAVEKKKPVDLPLLDNKEYICLLKKCADLIAEFEQYHARMASDEGKMMVEMIGQRLRTAMLLSGAQSIDSDLTFNLMRHTPVPMCCAVNGVPIEEVIEIGIEVEDLVLVKAKVKLKK